MNRDSISCIKHKVRLKLRYIYLIKILLSYNYLLIIRYLQGWIHNPIYGIRSLFMLVKFFYIFYIFRWSSPIFIVFTRWNLGAWGWISLMKKKGMWLEMAVDWDSWRNASALGRPTRVGVQTRASGRKCHCDSVFIFIIWLCQTRARTDSPDWFGSFLGTTGRTDTKRWWCWHLAIYFCRCYSHIYVCVC